MHANRAITCVDCGKIDEQNSFVDEGWGYLSIVISSTDERSTDPQYVNYHWVLCPDCVQKWESTSIDLEANYQARQRD